ncbi:DNA repair helicase XPB [Paenibacillus thermoaerophilus]|uniref:DNA 3'-5' helicase n=1 Tax=Paenibacillus thermoaerophilus TaxID=1215385 RepID=A0ABW2V1T8_9BACL|nr:DNA repair helicase XPB [Paenibacillus thermoaerophilus]TMV19131.1 DEAD/DEAH box helicase [Paenibacillus thermoaerophilus]
MRESTEALIVQADGTVLLDTAHPQADELAERLSRFADLVKSPGPLQVYRMTPLSLWNAAETGETEDGVLDFLDAYSRYGLHANTERLVAEAFRRHGLLKLSEIGGKLRLEASERGWLERTLAGRAELADLPREERPDGSWSLRREDRGVWKQRLLRLGYPVRDLAGYHRGRELPVSLRHTSRSGRPLTLRDYQLQAADAFLSGERGTDGSGVVVLPCGAGKTIVGLAVMAKLRCETLILTASATSVRQWKRELLDKTDLQEDDIGEYDGDRKEVRPVTIATYQILTHRRSKTGGFSHMSLFSGRDWGLIVYDEVHLLPAPVFRATADIQATRRLGLTATLVREDGCEEDVYSLIGPKRFELPWRRLEAEGWIAEVQCRELRVPMPEPERQRYLGAGLREQFRLASVNPAKQPVVDRLLERHRRDRVLVIGQYLDQLRELSDRLKAPFISGSMPQEEREKLYEAFRDGREPVLVVSKVANFAVDLPDANALIQVSGSYGSRQEEAQRLGRLLRPKPDGRPASFYSVVTRDTREQEFSANRRLFLLEQGYRYEVEG